MPVTQVAPVKRLAVALAAAVVSACSPPPTPITLEFAAAFNGRTIDCESDESGVQMTDLRFYVHDVVLVAEDGSMLEVELTPDNGWQSDSVALVDLETGEGACLNGTPETHSQVTGTYPGGKVSGIHFQIGVPEALNHNNPITAEPPLGYTVMHWHWASGYKFIRAGIERAGDSVFLHLGSSRCEGTIGDIKGCRSNNRPQVRLDAFDAERDRIVFDLGLLFTGTRLDDGKRSECMSGPGNPDCEAPFRQLGIDMESGESVAPALALTGSPKQ